MANNARSGAERIRAFKANSPIPINRDLPVQLSRLWGKSEPGEIAAQLM
jgi:hypothetical protein